MAKPWEKYGGGQTSGGVFSLPPTEEDARRARAEAERLRIAQDAEVRATQTQANSAAAQAEQLRIAQARLIADL
ncbi:MAG: hypothetical protein ACRCYS_17325, partial [Beijerinckiaceae bacterium]